jgi:predicted RecB family nuclease
VARLSPAVPVHPERDFAAGAAATLALMQQGVPWIHQGVLLHGDRLGIPDLLRRVTGESALGAHHYEVVDVKTSGRPRGDQILQVVFYARLLAATQGRMPLHSSLVLKDGSEETFAVADYEAACSEVEEALVALRRDPDRAAPFLQHGCEGCHWNHRCLPQLERQQDLSLVHGMSRGAAAVLGELGVKTVEELAIFEPHGERERGHLDPLLLRRLRKGAQAHLLGAPVAERQPQGQDLQAGALVHLLTDPYADAVLWIGVRHPLADARVREEWPAAGSAWRALRGLVEALPADVPLLHIGHELPRMYEDHAHRCEASAGLAERFVELGRRLRGAAVHPGPVFTFADLVRHGLGRDPFRHGHAGECAMWRAEAAGRERLSRKGQGDLDDLAALVERFLSRADAAVPQKGGVVWT